MSSNDILPPRISNTPPPIDTSFDDENSKSAEDFTNYHLDDSDLVGDTKVDDIAELEIDDENLEKERSNTLTKEEIEDEEESNEMKKIEGDSFKYPDPEDDSFNLSDDKLKTIIENFKISSNDESGTTQIEKEEESFFQQEPQEEQKEESSNWDPFGEDNNNQNKNEANDWAAFDEQIENKEEEDDWDNFVSVQEAVVEDSRKNEEIYFDTFIRNASKLFEKSIESEKSFETDESIQVDENYLFEANYVKDAWNKLVDYKNSNSLKFIWRGSKIEEFYLNSINIDKKNVNTTSRLLDVRTKNSLFNFLNRSFRFLK